MVDKTKRNKDDAYTSEYVESREEQPVETPKFAQSVVRCVKCKGKPDTDAVLCKQCGKTACSNCSNGKKKLCGNCLNWG